MHRAPRAETALPAARTHTLAQFSPQESELEPEPEPNKRQPSFQDDGGAEAVPQLTLELDLDPEPKPEPTITTSSPRVHRRPVTPPHTATAIVDPKLDFQPHKEAEQARPAAEKAEQERIAADQMEQARPAAEKAEQERVTAEPQPEPEPTVALSPAVPECETAGFATLADSAPQDEPVSKAAGALPMTHRHAAVSVGELDCDVDLQPLSNQQLMAIVKDFVSSGAQSSLLADLILEQRSATDRAAGS